jgi:hypothetical protein
MDTNMYVYSLPSTVDTRSIYFSADHSMNPQIHRLYPLKVQSVIFNDQLNA